MLVESLSHGKQVFDRVAKWPWVAFDTEGRVNAAFSDPEDALVYDRYTITFFSICYLGEAYSFPTSAFYPTYPTFQDWLKFLNPIFKNPEIIKVGHNLKFDIQGVHCHGGAPFNRIWDTLIGCWLAAPYLEKGLKARATNLGRFLQETAAVNLNSLTETSVYAEQDVVATDELFQLQTKGSVFRPKTISCLAADGKLDARKNEMPLVVDESTAVVEKLRNYERWYLSLQELPVLRATIRAERKGFPLDTDGMASRRKAILADASKAKKEIFQKVGHTFNLGSNKQLGEVFSNLGIASPVRSKKTGKESFGAEALALMQGVHPVVDKLLAHRKMEKLISVYIGENAGEGLEHFINPKTESIHCSMSTVGAVTGRFTVANPNLTQIPSRADTYKIKETFVPPKGKLLICLDYSQLEIRVMALLAREKNMLKVLNDPHGDIHTLTANHFGVSRQVAKQLNFLLLYGGGFRMLARKLTIEGMPTTEEEAKNFIQGYDADLYPGVIKYRHELLNDHQTHEYTVNLTGRRRHLPDIEWNNDFSVHKAETTLSNNQIQSSGQDLLKASIVRCDPKCLNPDKVWLENRKSIYSNHDDFLIKESESDFVYRLRMHSAYLMELQAKLAKYRREFALAKLDWILQVHDEAVYFADAKASEDVSYMIADIMTWRPFWLPISPMVCPIGVEGGVGESWAHAKSKSPLFKTEARSVSYQF